MNIYIYNNNKTEQSIRQMITTLTYLKYDELYLDGYWQGRINISKSINFMSLNDFLNISGKKAIVFFNIIDGYKLKKSKVKSHLVLVFRPRGIIPEESYYRNKNIIKKLALNFIEKKVIESTDYFIFLNEQQKIHYMNKYPLCTSVINNISVLPNVKGAQSKILKDINSSDIRIVYSGGFSQWQKIELVFEIVSDMINRFDYNIKFTILTFKNNFEKANELAMEFNIIDDFTVKYCEPNDLDEELIKYDIGFLIRDDNNINSTASPFKIIDYIYNGLGLINTDNFIDQIRNIIDESCCFYVKVHENKIRYSKDNLESFINSFKNTDKKRNIVNSYNSFISRLDKIRFD